MKAPWFPFYTGDFLASPDVQLMEAHEVGAYLLLLANSWQTDTPGYITADEGRLRRICRFNADQWADSRELLLNKWPLAANGLRHNPRLVHEAGNQQARRERLAANGQKGGRPPQKQKDIPEKATDNLQVPDNNLLVIPAEPTGLLSSSQPQSTNVDDEREQDSSSLKLEVGGQPLNADTSTPTIVAGPPAVDPAKAAALAGTDYDEEQPWQESPLTKPVAFQVMCDRVVLYRGIAYEHYRQLALAAVEGTDTRRTVKQWQSWIHKFLANQTPRGGKLLTGGEVADQAKTGVHAPQSPDAPNHRPRPEVQARKDAEFEVLKQQRIAANFARTAAEGALTQPLPGTTARGF